MDEQQQQPAAPSVPFQNPLNVYSGSLMSLTNPESELDKMENTFRNERLTEDGKRISFGKALMNDNGINSVRGQVQSIVNQICIIGNLNKQDIPMLIDFLADTLAKDLMVNRYIYEITNSSARSKIFFISLTTAYMTMKRALDEGDRRFWKGSQQDIRMTTVQDGQKRGGMLSRMNPWGKK